MSDRNKVIWSEGQFLLPQHFQQQERYFEHYVEARTRTLQTASWGFEDLEIELKAGQKGLSSVAIAAAQP